MCNNSDGPNARKAKEAARERSNGVCQFCGQRPVAEGHHWLVSYLPDACECQVTADHITALCRHPATKSRLRSALVTGGSQEGITRAVPDIIC